MEKIFCFFFCIFACTAVYPKNDHQLSNTVPVFIYDLKPTAERGTQYAVAMSGYSLSSGEKVDIPFSKEIKQFDGKAISNAIKQAKSAICESAENIDVKIWMSFGAHGEVGIGSRIGGSVESGFEVIFHCGKLKPRKD